MYLALEVDLSPATAQVNEGDDTTLTATLSMPADRPVTVRVQTRDGTAIGKVDNDDLILYSYFGSVAMT